MPAATDTIPEGLATRLGKYATALLAVVAAVTAVLEGDHSQETLLAGAGAVAVLLTLMGGRFAQAAALYRGPAAGVAVTGDVPSRETGLAEGEAYELPDYDGTHETRDVHDAKGDDGTQF